MRFVVESERSADSSPDRVAVERSLAEAGEHAMYFRNAGGQRLFAVLNQPATAARMGVVFCHPIGEEKQKSYRAYVQFARFLAAAGIPCLRFDCHGFGDSAGDTVEATVESQLDDTCAAMEQLRESSGVTSVVLLGARFGATVAALSASNCVEVVGLGLFSPIVDGQAYWKQLLRTQQMSYMTRGEKPKKRDELLAILESEGCLEIEADLLSADFVEQLCGVDLCETASKFHGRCLLTAVESDRTDYEQARKLAANYRSSGAVVTGCLGEQRDFWSSQSLYDGYLPIGLYERVSTWIREIES